MKGRVLFNSFYYLLVLLLTIYKRPKLLVQNFRNFRVFISQFLESYFPIDRALKEIFAAA